MFLDRARNVFRAPVASPVPGARLSDPGGFVSGTLVATPGGWRPVEALAVGDALLTFDGGAQTLTGVGRSLLWTPIEQCPPELWPIVVPAGAVGNRCRMRALPGTRFLVESDLAEQITGDPFCVIPAASLIDAGIATQEPPTSFVEIMTLTFDSEQLVYSDGGALIMSGSAMPGEPLDVDGLLQDPVGRSYAQLDTETEAQIARDAIDLSRIGLTAA
jgi:hypothetical protein